MLTVASGGSVDVETGGKILANGTQASHIADAAVAAGTAPDKAEFDAVVGKLNAVLAALEGVGVLASS
ncbi:MAG: hypothetical protein BWY94_02367 [Actinobacteria bacterium ADurb.BinA094]|nr:MAG: hypothetical protein BWY94_02367 [Actinobacteria bacterium ADurb.BinA094]